MHRIKQYFRTAFRLLILGLLSSWTVVQRLIKYILERIIKKEEVKEAKYVSIADNRGSPVSSPTVQPETKTIETQVQPEKIEPAPIADNRGSPALSPTVQPETKTIETEGNTLALDATEAYCVKCRQKRAIQGARKVTTPKGRRAVEGTCSVCGTKLFRFIARGKENLSEEG